MKHENMRLKQTLPGMILLFLLLGSTVYALDQSGIKPVTPTQSEEKKAIADHVRKFTVELQASNKLIEDAASILKMDSASLRQQLNEGKSLSAVSEKQGIPVSDLVERMTALYTENLKQNGSFDEEKLASFRELFSAQLRKMAVRTDLLKEDKLEKSRAKRDLELRARQNLTSPSPVSPKKETELSY